MRGDGASRARDVVVVVAAAFPKRNVGRGAAPDGPEEGMGIDTIDAGMLW